MVVGRPGGAPVAAVIVGVHHVAGVDERLGQAAVPPGVLAHAVGHLHDRPRVAVAAPAVGGDLGAVPGLRREAQRRLVHEPQLCHSVPRPRRPWLAAP